MERTLTRLKARLIKLNARRVFIGEDFWYWTSSPTINSGK